MWEQSHADGTLNRCKLVNHPRCHWFCAMFVERPLPVDCEHFQETHLCHIERDLCCSSSYTMTMTTIPVRDACGRRAVSPLLGLVVLVVMSIEVYVNYTVSGRKAIQSITKFKRRGEFYLQDPGCKDEVDNIPILMMNDSTPFFDPFTKWTLRADITNQTVREVLYRVDHSAPCRKALYYPSMNGTSSLEQIAASIQRKLRTGDRKIVVAVMGDSVAASYRGFIEALKSMLVTSPYLDFDIEMRNLAVGGAHVRYHFFCNKLIGDEDIVIFESVHLDEPEIVDLAQSLQRSGYGVLLITWRRPVFMRRNYVVNEGKRAADSFNIPCLTLNERDSALRSCLPSSADQSKTVKELLFKDEVHPNRLGELTIAAFIGRTIEQTVREYLPRDITSDTAALVSLPERTMSSFDAVCFGRLVCEEGAPKSIGTNQCLNVTKYDGFQLGTLQNENGSIRKQWWEGLKPGDQIEMHLDEPCSSIVLFHNLRPTNGMVMVRIDGKVVDPIEQYIYAGKLPQGVLNGWRRDDPVLGPERGQMQAVYIGVNLEPTPHTVGFEVLRKTDSIDGSYHFDFIALACK
jgi:hypothetical protein